MIDTYKDFFSKTYEIVKWMITDLKPIISEMEKAAWGPLGETKERVGTILTIASAAMIIIKILKNKGYL